MSDESTLTPNALCIRVAGGVTVAVPDRMDLLTPYVLLEQEDWFEDEIKFVRKVMRPGMRAVDIGANYGLYTLAIAKGVGPSGRVWAVEPSSATSAYLRESIRLNAFSQVTVIQKALSDREGTAKLSISANSELNTLINAADQAGTEEVDLSTLDSLANSKAWGPVDFLKLDAEGEEERILKGGAAFLRSSNPLVMFEIRHGDRLNLHLVDRLKSAGYASYELVPGLGLLAPFNPDATRDQFRLNLFACKPERAKLLAESGHLVLKTKAKLQAKDPVEHYRDALDETLAPALRFSSLQAALRVMVSLCDTGDAYRLGSCARFACAFGEREQAIELLRRALANCATADPGAAAEPFVPASAAFDALPASGRHAEWLRASLLDQLLRLNAFSSYFMQPTESRRSWLLSQLEALRSTGFQRPAMERMRQLIRIFSGLQPGRGTDPLLIAYGPENLNPDLWGGPRPKPH